MVIGIGIAIAIAIILTRESTTNILRRELDFSVAAA